MTNFNFAPVSEGKQEKNEIPILLLNKGPDSTRVEEMKLVNLIPFELISRYSEAVVFGMLLDSSKTLLKTTAETLYEAMNSEIKDPGFSVSLLEIQKILHSIHFVDNENQQNLVWIGPDCVNLTGITREVLKNSPTSEETLYDTYASFVREFPHELSQRENSFFVGLYYEFINDPKTKVDLRWFSPKPEFFREMNDEKQFREYAFAMLKSKTWSFYIKKPQVMIGRSAVPNDHCYVWDLDVDLQTNKFVSKQHAIILYNFQKESFEIKCLSRKNEIKVNSKTLSYESDPMVLPNESLIEIGGERMHFLLPKGKKPKTVN